MMKSGPRKSIVIISLLCLIIAPLVVAMVILYGSRYNAGITHGEDTQEAKQIEVIKSDPHKAVIPNYVGQNLSGVMGESLLGTPRIDVNDNVSLTPRFVTPNGEAITSDNAKDYKIVSQDPKAGTAFEVQYEKDDNGKELSLVQSTGIDVITLTLEKVKQ